jgi:hypothetical protein
MGHKVKAGDVVYPVSVSEGKLLILARVEVGEVMTVVDFVEMQRAGRIAKVPPETLGWLAPTCTDDAAAAVKSTALRVDCAVPGEMVEKIRMVTPKGEERPIKHVKDGKVIRTAGMDGHYYRLSEKTREMFDGVVAGR